MVTKIAQEALWQKFESHLLNEQVTQRRIAKLKYVFSVCERGLKDFSKAKRADIEKFTDDLNRNHFLKLDGQQYSGNAKSDIKKFIKQFFKWYKGNNEAYPPEVAWLKTKIGKNEKPEDKPVLSLEEVSRFAHYFKKIELRLLALILFDSGFRIAEALSIKKKDLTFEPFEDDKKCFWVFCNESKTLKRKVDIPLFTEDIAAFVNSSYYQSLKDDEPIFRLSYSDIIKNFKRASAQLFGVDKSGHPLKVITPHCLRHSSATFYSVQYEGNMVQIAQRYGWSYSSDELKTYIRRSGAYQKAGAKKIYSNEIVLLKNRINELEAQLTEHKKDIDTIMKLWKAKSEKEIQEVFQSS